LKPPTTNQVVVIVMGKQGYKHVIFWGFPQKVKMWGKKLTGQTTMGSGEAGKSTICRWEVQVA
jgi:hypothetical protein